MMMMSKYIRKSDLFDIHRIKQSWKDMENVHKKVLESPGKQRSVVCVHPELHVPYTIQ